MLNLNLTHIDSWYEMAADPTDLPSIVEGMALQNEAIEGSTAGMVLRSSSSSSQNFAGIAYGPSRNVTIASTIEAYSVPTTTPYQIVLQGLAVSAANVAVFYGSTLFTQGSPGANTYAVDSVTINGVQLTRLTFAASSSGYAINVVYRKVLSANVAALQYGEFYNRTGSDLLGSVSVIVSGVVYTDQFAVTSDFSSSSFVTMTAGGLIASATDTTATGTIIPNAAMRAVPNATVPYVGIFLR